jgi:hypothetical protein
MTDGSAASVQGLLQTGFQLFQQGRAEEAWNAFHEAVARDPQSAFAHHMIGLIALQAGALEMGVDSLRRAIALQPDDPAAWGNLANGLRELQRTDEALEAYARALTLAPGFADALNNRAILLGRLGRHAESLADYDRAIAAEPRAPSLHNNRADALRALGRAEEAVAGYQHALALDPDLVEAWYNLGGVLAAHRRPKEALAAFDKALALRPGMVEARMNRANVLVDLARHDEALEGYDQALAFLRADAAEAAPAFSNRANVLRMLGRHAEAIESCDVAIRLDPAYADPLLNRAAVEMELGRIEKAAADAEASLALNPDLADAGFIGGMAHLSLGDFERGWARYEARLDMRGQNQFAAERDLPQPYWRGQAPLEGKTLLLYSEQGLGDTLQFCRYAALAKAAGANVILEVEAPLVRLLSTLEGADLVLEKGAPLPPFDLHASLMSLPLAFGTRLDTVPAKIPYLYAEPDKAAAWAARLHAHFGGRRRPRVGLVWSGGFRPDQPSQWNINRRRNIPLETLAPLAGAAVDFVSLQKGEPAESELAALVAQGWNGPALADFASGLNDFSDTAALIDNLDLVISVDTSTAHLAGAMDKPVWILNRFDNCWRWLLHRSDSPWYPTARLFRQAGFDDWAPVVREVAAALKSFAS